MKRASAILSTIGFIWNVAAFPAYAILAVIFGVLSSSNSIFGEGNPRLGIVLTVVFGTWCVLSLIGLITGAWARAKVVNDPDLPIGYGGHIASGIISLNLLMILSGILGQHALKSKK